jgi:hypothetical protein
MIRRLAILNLCASLAVACVTPALGQTSSLSDAWAGYLRPGCHVVLALPTTQLEVQTKWLGPITIGRLADVYRGACPTESVKVSSVEFGPPVLDVLRIQTGLGRDFFRLYADATRAPDGPTASASQTVTHSFEAPAIAASIEMRRAQELGLKDRGLDDRWYDLRYYRTSDEAPTGQARIVCSGRERARFCNLAGWPRLNGVLVHYNLSQWRLPVPEIVSTDPSTESGAIQQFDQRLREWLVTLERTRE